MAVFETVRLVVDRDEAVVKEVKEAEVVALRVSHVKVDETETLVALNKGVVILAVALTVWAVTRPVTDNEGTEYVLVMDKLVVVMVPVMLRVPLDHSCCETRKSPVISRPDEPTGGTDEPMTTAPPLGFNSRGDPLPLSRAWIAPYELDPLGVK